LDDEFSLDLAAGLGYPRLAVSCLRKKEYFLSFKDFPYFRDQTLNSIQNVQLRHGYHLSWPDPDIDLEIDNLENVEKYPLRSAIPKKPANHSHLRAAARS
jgi:hypothetical protein